jgi:hypothetical protein
MMARLAGWEPENSTTTIVSSSTTTTSGLTSTSTVLSPTTTTTSIINVCSIEEIYGENSEEAALLRYLRDNVLGKTIKGQEIIKLYYQWSPFIIKSMNQDKGFRKDLSTIIDDILSLISTEIK